MGLNTAYGGSVVVPGGGAPDLLHVVQQTAAGVDGGSAAATTWNVKPLNVVRTNDIPGASLGSNQVTLPAGTYYAEARSEAYKIDHSKIRLRNVTDGTTALIGTSSFGQNVDNDGTASELSGRFTIPGIKVFELQHWSRLAQTGTGLGLSTVGGDGEVNIYAELRIEKIS